MNYGLNDGSRPYQMHGVRDWAIELLAVFFVFCAPNLFLFAAGYTPSGDLTVGLQVSDLLARIGWCALVPFLLTRRDAFDWKLPRTGREWGKESGWGVLLVLAVVGCSTLIGLVVNALGLDDPTTSLTDSAWDKRVLATFLLSTPIIGLHEELVFRVYAQTRLTQILSSKRVLPVLIASVVFSAMHGYSLAGTLMILSFGLVMGTSFQANGKIPRLVIAHTLWNVGAGLLDLFWS